MQGNINFLNFNNPSQGRMVFAQVVSEVVKFIKRSPNAQYRIMIGSDSHGQNIVDLVSVVAIHRVGNGGRYFWTRTQALRVHSLQHKIYTEVENSLALASQFTAAFRRSIREERVNFPETFAVEIHVDVGSSGETRDLVGAITGMVRSFGYPVYVKPQSVAASGFADRHSK